MQIHPTHIAKHNERHQAEHRETYAFLKLQLDKKGFDADATADTLRDFQVAIPSWALGTGGTRFGRFSCGGEPRSLEEKINDIGILHALTRSAGAISLHIPWDLPGDAKALRQLAAGHDLVFDAVNSNTFQDQPGQNYSYKFGSLCHTDDAVREQSVQHNIEVIRQGETLGSKSLTVWLADGSSFPGQSNFRKALERTLDSLQKIYAHLPADWKIFIEYKPYEPNFYSMVIPDWGTSHLLTNALGERAFCLVDLGHHLPNTNIEQIVATLLWQKKLGGFHFNDSKFGDDDLSVGCIKPYQLFLIFNELVQILHPLPQTSAGVETLPTLKTPPPEIAWMIDASHNLKDPLEDLLQSLEAIRLAYAQALILDRQALEEAQAENDVTRAQEILQEAFRTDVRPLLREARLRSGAALEPVQCFREMRVREELITERGMKTVATGL